MCSSHSCHNVCIGEYQIIFTHTNGAIDALVLVHTDTRAFAALPMSRAAVEACVHLTAAGDKVVRLATQWELTKLSV